MGEKSGKKVIFIWHDTLYNLNVKVVDLQLIYNEFRTGSQDIAALRNFVKYVYDNASSPDNRLKYLCLFGEGSYDYKDRINNNTITDHINVYKNNIDERALWKAGTTLIIGDSMLNGLEETRLKNCKVRVYPGASIEDMHYNLIPLLRKQPTNIIIHAGTNNCVNDNSRQIIEKLLDLNDFILRRLPNCRVINDE